MFKKKEIEYKLHNMRKSRDKWLGWFNEKCKEKSELKKENVQLRAELYQVKEARDRRTRWCGEQCNKISKLEVELKKYMIDYSYLLVLLDRTACEWTPDKDNNEDFKKFHTACGHTYLAEASDEIYTYSALENGTATFYCPYCGKGVHIKKGDIANVDSD